MKEKLLVCTGLYYSRARNPPPPTSTCTCNEGVENVYDQGDRHLHSQWSIFQVQWSRPCFPPVSWLCAETEGLARQFFPRPGTARSKGMQMWTSLSFKRFYNKHTCREVSSGFDAPRVAGNCPNLPSEPNLQVCLVFIPCPFAKILCV